MIEKYWKLKEIVEMLNDCTVPIGEEIVEGRWRIEEATGMLDEFAQPRQKR